MTFKVREVSTETGYEKDITELIDTTLSELSPIELIDIKYQTLALNVGGGYIIRTSALIIYKEVQ